MPNTVGGALGAHREMTSLDLKKKSITYIKEEGEKMKVSDEPPRLGFSLTAFLF